MNDQGTKNAVNAIGATMPASNEVTTPPAVVEAGNDNSTLDLSNIVNSEAVFANNIKSGQRSEQLKQQRLFLEEIIGLDWFDIRVQAAQEGWKNHIIPCGEVDKNGRGQLYVDPFTLEAETVKEALCQLDGIKDVKFQSFCYAGNEGFLFVSEGHDNYYDFMNEKNDGDTPDYDIHEGYQLLIEFEDMSLDYHTSQKTREMIESNALLDSMTMRELFVGAMRDIWRTFRNKPIIEEQENASLSEEQIELCANFQDAAKVIRECAPQLGLQGQLGAFNTVIADVVAVLGHDEDSITLKPLMQAKYLLDGVVFDFERQASAVRNRPDQIEELEKVFEGSIEELNRAVNDAENPLYDKAHTFRSVVQARLKDSASYEMLKR